MNEKREWTNDVISLRSWGFNYCEWLNDQDLSQNTRRSYVGDLGGFIHWFEMANGEEFDPSKLTSIDLRAWRKSMISFCKPATWNRRRSSMMAFIKWARERGDLKYDPMENIRAAKEVQNPPRWIIKKDQNKLLREVERQINFAKTNPAKRKTIRDGAMVALMLFAGLRESEVVALDLGDITIKERSGSVVVRNGKGGKRREIPLNHEARLAVGRWIEYTGSEEFPDWPLFVSGVESRTGVRTVQRRISSLGALIDLKLTPHMLRHTFAKRLVDCGTPLTVIQRLMGHSRLETTARYVEPGWEDFENAVEAI